MTTPGDGPRTNPDPLRAALEVARHFDDDALACDFAGQTAINLPNLDVVIPLAADTARPGLDVEALRDAIYEVSVRHDWENTTDRADRTEEIAAEYAARLPEKAVGLDAIAMKRQLDIERNATLDEVVRVVEGLRHAQVWEYRKAPRDVLDRTAVLDAVKALRS